MAAAMFPIGATAFLLTIDQYLIRLIFVAVSPTVVFTGMMMLAEGKTAYAFCLTWGYVFK